MRRRARARFLTSGFDPGWSGDVIPLALASACERVDSVRVSELMDYSTYADPDFTGVYFGYGRPLDYAAPLLQPGMLKGGWGGMVLMLADALGIRLDEIREEHERLPAPESFETAMGKIEKGTCAAVRFEVQGIVDGRPVVVAAHVNRLRDDVGPALGPPLGRQEERLQDRGEGLARRSPARSSRAARTATTTPPASPARRCAW